MGNNKRKRKSNNTTTYADNEGTSTSKDDVVSTTENKIGYDVISNEKLIKITPEKASRILHCNPVCFLVTTVSGKTNVMTLSWITPANNYGGFVFIIHKTRYSATDMTENSYFSLSVANSSHRTQLLACGKASGRNVDKLGGAIEGLESESFSSHNSEHLRETKKSNGNSFSVLGSSSEDEDECEDGTDSSNKDSKAVSTTSTDNSNIPNNDYPEAIKNTAGRILCRIVRRCDAADAGHWLVTAQIEDAYVHPSYWDGKCFAPQTSTTPPLLSFLGSQRFGFIVTDSDN
jgi:flavin reductase (DIM6/NTAB) family NADH-FMN oxidoreductase RutF